MERQEKLAERVRLWMQRNDLTVSKISKITGRSRTTIIRWATTANSWPNLADEAAIRENQNEYYCLSDCCILCELGNRLSDEAHAVLVKAIREYIEV